VTTVTTQGFRRDRMVILAVWLIALGSVFLAKDLGNWSWAEAWPLWVVFVGVGSAASTLLSGQRAPSLIWSISWPLAAVVVGVILLLATTGSLDLTLTEILAWWPVVVIAIGLWFLIGALVVRDPDLASATLSLPLGGAAAADVRIRFGGGELSIGRAEEGALLAGRFDGGVVHRSRGPGIVELEPVAIWPFGWRRALNWDVGLTTEVPVDLRLETGANRSDIDLSSLRIRRLELKTGASETRIVLPSAGVTFVRAEAGVASLTLEVPLGVAARVRSKIALGETSIDTRRFPPSGEGWESPDYEAAANRVDIEVQGGLGSVRIVSGA
jgi:hypothetical protein